MAVDRRTMLAAGGAAAILGPVRPAQAEAARRPAILIFDSRSVEARAEASRTFGHRLVALGDDPVRIWRDVIANHMGPIAGVTRWNDYLILRGLAEERRLRLRSEERLATTGGAMIVRWRMG